MYTVQVFFLDSLNSQAHQVERKEWGRKFDSIYTGNSSHYHLQFRASAFAPYTSFRCLLSSRTPCHTKSLGAQWVFFGCRAAGMMAQSQRPNVIKALSIFLVVLPLDSMSDHHHRASVPGIKQAGGDEVLAATESEERGRPGGFGAQNPVRRFVWFAFSRLIRRDDHSHESDFLLSDQSEDIVLII